MPFRCPLGCDDVCAEDEDDESYDQCCRSEAVVTQRPEHHGDIPGLEAFEDTPNT